MSSGVAMGQGSRQVRRSGDGFGPPELMARYEVLMETCRYRFSRLRDLAPTANAPWRDYFQQALQVRDVLACAQTVSESTLRHLTA